jgi:hypothetical protein
MSRARWRCGIAPGSTPSLFTSPAHADSPFPWWPVESRNSALRSGTATTTAGRISTPSSRASVVTRVPSSMPYRFRSLAGTTMVPRLPTFTVSMKLSRRLYIRISESRADRVAQGSPRVPPLQPRCFAWCSTPCNGPRGYSAVAETRPLRLTVLHWWSPSTYCQSPCRHQTMCNCR